MSIIQVTDMKKVEPIFEGWQETLIWSCLQGVMGEIYTDNLEHPESAFAWLGDFGFYAGKPCEELVRFKPEHRNAQFLIMVPENEGWAELIADVYGENANRFLRYAIKKEENVFDTEKLQKVVDSLAPEYEMKQIDQEVFDYAKQHDWTYDWCSQFPDYAMYQKDGLGFVISKDGEIVAGASSYSCYKQGIEIEIKTKEEYRRKGLAYVCAARLILECKKRNLYPSWDAANQWSVGLAEKLGYHFDHEYTAFMVLNYH